MSEPNRNSYPTRRFRASITVEAALCLPLFLFTAVMLLAPLKMMEYKRQLQNNMEATAKDLAQAAYVEALLKEEGSGFLNQKKGSAGAETIDGSLEGFLEGANTAYAAARVLSALDGKVFQNPYFSRCEIIQNDLIEMELCYELKLPFRIFGIDHITQSSVVNRRAWTGSKGGRGAERYGSGETWDEDGYTRDEDGDRVVYVGKTSTVYHKDRNCHYLDNVLKKVSAGDVGALRNASGGTYHACESCKPKKTGDVYILENGTAYHSSEHCKALAAYAREVKLSEVEHMGACSYCSGGGKGHQHE